MANKNLVKASFTDESRFYEVMDNAQPDRSGAISSYVHIAEH
ncbi:MAG: hypothetical protein SPI30_06965 [Prevotella sp.]|nr:hypothetical protein [Prevotella sp.]